MFIARHDLAHDMRIGEMRPRHPDHIELALGHRVAGCRHIGDTRRVKGREFR